ncbi:MAG: hypothetical protein KGR24_04920 [Planctomycetes bacterium]|nr:hypothetical protein [Planctomycetota bacterium]
MMRSGARLPVALVGAVIAFAVGGGRPAAQDALPSWQRTVAAAAFRKQGVDRPELPPSGFLANPHYQCETIGLGGTVVRVGPHGFTSPAAPAVDRTGHLESRPYLSQQHWWDEEAHRHQPFDLVGGYGDDVTVGEIQTFRHLLDIATGFLQIDLTLAAQGTSWRSRREMFVTPEGVWVVRVTDMGAVTMPFRLRIDPNRNVRIYLNGGVYARTHEPWSAAATANEKGLFVTAERPRSCTAALAVAIDAATPFVDASSRVCGAIRPGSTITFYIAPASSYGGGDATETAWAKAEAARRQGFNVLRKQTARWWRAFFAMSSVVLPDRDLATWYARSIWYLGVFFGNTDVPPGCNGTSLESFAGAICPEYDLVIDQRALLYSNHGTEARHVCDWAGGTLPQARTAREGLTLHEVSVRYDRGAKYGPLLGHDGTVLVPPTTREGIWAHEDFAGTNLALVALDYVDWSGDESRSLIASKLLRETTQVMAQELVPRPDIGGHLHQRMPSTVQQAAAAFALREASRRGEAEDGWDALAGAVYLPTADHEGGRVLVAGPGAVAERGRGDVTWLVPLWWYGIIGGDDPLVKPTYDMVRESMTGDYVFNNGWMGVIAAKRYDGAEAHRWARELLRPGVTLFDDCCFGEIIADREDFKKTPEVAAHAALVCAVSQMLLDPDSDRELTVFPALPAAWQRDRVAFSHLAARGGILVSGERSPRAVSVVVENRATGDRTRTLRVRLPAGTTTLRIPEARVSDEWAIIPDIQLAPGERRRFDLLP